MKFLYAFIFIMVILLFVTYFSKLNSFEHDPTNFADSEFYEFVYSNSYDFVSKDFEDKFNGVSDVVHSVRGLLEFVGQRIGTVDKETQEYCSGLDIGIGCWEYPNWLNSLLGGNLE